MRAGTRAFGGWTATAEVLEQELVRERHLMRRSQLRADTAYAQVLPGATQVTIVAEAGHQLRGLPGAVVATVSYVLPATILVVLFAVAYFQFRDQLSLESKLGGLTATLGGLVLANAITVGRRHAHIHRLWLIVVAAWAAQFILHINPVLVILGSGVAGLIVYYVKAKPRGDTQKGGPL